MPEITVLGSGVALGVYIPALLTARRLVRHGVAAEVEVIERCYNAASREQLERFRQAYHRDFSLALLGHRSTRDIRPSLDEDAVAGLLERWRHEGRRHFAVWSGFWLPILDRYRREYRESAPGRLEIDLCRIDAEVSASFKIYGALCEALGDEAREVWLWNGRQQRLDYELPVSDEPVVAWEERDDRLVVHGGGWGIGTYRERIPELTGRGFALDAVAHDAAEADGGETGVRWLLVDPAWRAWPANGEPAPCVFPPFGEVGGTFGDPDERGNLDERGNPDERHEIYGLIRGSRAIVSKPGGGTLIDSLASATPVVLLEPYGYAEEANARLWEHLGFGVSWARWRESGFSREILAGLHHTLRTRPRDTVDYPASLAARLHA